LPTALAPALGKEFFILLVISLSSGLATTLGKEFLFFLNNFFA
jgi:hypothetical protein